MAGRAGSSNAYATAAFGIALVAAAGLLDAEPLYVPGIACLVLVVVAVAWVALAAHRVNLVRTVSARRVQEGEPVQIVIEAAARHPVPGGAVLDNLLPHPAPVRAGRRGARVRIVVRFDRRGRRLLAPPALCVRDPFGLVTRIVTGGADAEVLVLPRVEPVRVPPGGHGADAIATARRGRPVVAAEIELDGLRPHREGVSAARIAWPVLARTGELWERQLRADSDTRPLLILDPRGARSADDEDAAVRATASLAVHLARAGGCSVLVPGDRRPVALDATLAGWPHLHARLALVAAGAAPAFGALSARRGPVVFVSARALTRPPRALARAPGGGRVLVVPAAIVTRRATFSVAGCLGYELDAGRRRAAA